MLEHSPNGISHNYDNRFIMEDVQTKMINGCKKVHHHLQNIFEVIQIGRTTPEWISYKDNINQLVIKGLRDSIMISLRYIYNSLVAKELQVFHFFILLRGSCSCNEFDEFISQF